MKTLLILTLVFLFTQAQAYTEILAQRSKLFSWNYTVKKTNPAEDKEWIKYSRKIQNLIKQEVLTGKVIYKGRFLMWKAENKRSWTLRIYTVREAEYLKLLPIITNELDYKQSK